MTALKILQSRCGVAPDNSFGPKTARAIADHFDLSDVRAAHLLGQSAHESGYFKHTEENLNYSEKALKSVFGRYFGEDKEDASQYERRPQKIANYVYMDKNRSKKGALGNVEENDGWAFRGRGFLQCTGRANYRKFASKMRLPDVMKDPDLLSTDYAFESAYWFFDRNKLFQIADQGVNDDVIKQITKRVNGGYHGLDDRIEQTNKIYRWLHV